MWRLLQLVQIAWRSLVDIVRGARDGLLDAWRRLQQFALGSLRRLVLLSRIVFGSVMAPVRTLVRIAKKWCISLTPIVVQLVATIVLCFGVFVAGFILFHVFVRLENRILRALFIFATVAATSGWVFRLNDLASSKDHWPFGVDPRWPGPLYLVTTFFGLALLYAVAYKGASSFGDQITKDGMCINGLFDYLYFSAVTAVGLGDSRFSPSGRIAEFLVMLETLLFWILVVLAGLGNQGRRANGLNSGDV